MDKKGYFYFIDLYEALNCLELLLLSMWTPVFSVMFVKFVRK